MLFVEGQTSMKQIAHSLLAAAAALTLVASSKHAYAVQVDDAQIANQLDQLAVMLGLPPVEAD